MLLTSSIGFIQFQKLRQPVTEEPAAIPHHERECINARIIMKQLPELQWNRTRT